MGLFNRTAGRSRLKRRLHQRTLGEVARAAEDGVNAIERRLRALDRDRDAVEQVETGISILAVAGAILGLTIDRRWYFLSAGMAGLLAGQALRSTHEPPVFGRHHARLGKHRILKSLRRH